MLLPVVLKPGAGAIGVARLITCSPSLKLVAMCRNKCGNEGAKSIATSIRRNNVLEEIWMQDRCIPPHCICLPHLLHLSMA